MATLSNDGTVTVPIGGRAFPVGRCSIERLPVAGDQVQLVMTFKRDWIGFWKALAAAVDQDVG